MCGCAREGGPGPSCPCMWFHLYCGAHRALLCPEGLRVVPLHVGVGWACHIPSAMATSIIRYMHPCKQSVTMHHASFCFLPAPGLLWLLEPAQGLLVSLLRIARAGLDPMVRAVQSCTLRAGLCSSPVAEARGDKQQLSLLQNK